MKKVLLITLAALFAAGAGLAQPPVNPDKIERIAGAGLTPFMSVKLTESFLKNAPPHVKSVLAICQWCDIEPEEGVFVFNTLFSGLMKQAHEKDVKIFTMIWVGPQGPSWLYQHGVPLVKSSTKAWDFPYYLSERYIFFLRRMIQAYADFLRNLAPEERALFVAHQICEGSTGDTRPYDGTIDNPAYEIPDDEWRVFRRKVWEWYRQSFWTGSSTLIPFVFTDDANTAIDRAWQIANLPVFGVKKGQFGHGFNNNDNGERMNAWHEFMAAAEQKNRTIFARGEYDNILLRAGWVQTYPVTAFYWSSLMALHSSIDFWNPATVLFSDSRLYPAMEFYNRYAGWRMPSRAPGAFSALRKELNADRIDEFSEQRFGRAVRTNKERFFAIQAAFAAYGARLDDPSVMNGHALATRRRTGKNDVGWDFERGNFEMFLHQVDADKTSAPWWNVGDEQTPYGRFARATDRATGKTKMFFRLHENFFENPKVGHSIDVRIVWYDEGGSWSLIYKSAGANEKVAATVTGDASNQWREELISIVDGDFSGSLASGSDLILNYNGGVDTKFHMIEVIRR